MKTQFYFHFPKDKDRNEKWIYFVNHKYCLPSKDSVIWIDHFEKKFIKCRKKTCKLMWELKPVPSVDIDKISNSSVSWLPGVHRRSPQLRKLDSDKLPFFIQQTKF